LKARLLAFLAKKIFAETGEGGQGAGEQRNKEVGFRPAWLCNIVCIPNSIADGQAFGLMP
jgi:hypothetical protein